MDLPGRGFIFISKNHYRFGGYFIYRIISEFYNIWWYTEESKIKLKPTVVKMMMS